MYIKGASMTNFLCAQKLFFRETTKLNLETTSSQQSLVNHPSEKKSSGGQQGDQMSL
jgi:hypothetical protein